MKFADPKNDIAFRKIFGNETKKIILISFLNSVLNLEDDKNTISSSTGLSLEEIENLQIQIMPGREYEYIIYTT